MVIDLWKILWPLPTIVAVGFIWSIFIDYVCSRIHASLSFDFFEFMSRPLILFLFFLLKTFSMFRFPLRLFFLMLKEQTSPI